MVCDAAAVRSSSASSFNKCFFCDLSMTLCLVYKTKRSDQSSDMIWSVCSLCWYLLISVQRRERAVFHCMCPDEQTRAWTESESEHICNCIQCRQDSGSDCHFCLLLTRRNTRFQHNQVLNEWTPVGGAYGEKKTIRRCLALEAVFMQMTGDVTLHLRSKVSRFL